MESGFYSFFKAIYYFVMFGLILAATYYVTKFLASRGLNQSKTKTMKLLETMPLGADKSLHLVKVGGQYYLIGSASKNLFLVSELDQEKLFSEQMQNSYNLNDIEIENYEDGLEGKDFGSYLGSMKGNLKKLKSMVRGNNGDEI